MRHTSSQHGFTLIETLVAIFILALTVGALLTLTAGGFFSIRYAKNDIVASNLLQESLEYIRNTRDTAAQQGITWSDWILQYDNAGCALEDGCMINPYAQDSAADAVVDCSDQSDGACLSLTYYDDVGLYAYSTLSRAFTTGVAGIPTTFVRTITFTPGTTEEGDPEVIVTARITWQNGTNPKQLTQSILLTPWNISI